LKLKQNVYTCVEELRKFYGRHHDLVNLYGISVSQMTMDMFHLPYTLPGPFFISWLITGFVKLD